MMGIATQYGMEHFMSDHVPVAMVGGYKEHNLDASPVGPAVVQRTIGHQSPLQIVQSDVRFALADGQRFCPPLDVIVWMGKGRTHRDEVLQFAAGLGTPANETQLPGWRRQATSD